MGIHPAVCFALLALAAFTAAHSESPELELQHPTEGVDKALSSATSSAVSSATHASESKSGSASSHHTASFDDDMAFKDNAGVSVSASLVSVVGAAALSLCVSWI
ncbi:hypothetical protein H4R34_004952 [Dimargaris verticillata]|uniref:Uncharacterized protein n=1 Tax=Dimargaris verticillata TaxID=2761393 RepID=A0A9W8B3A2_9FUNG|nr:hypothetical protein H4R34_004952 [Dimargaris verticillata]